MNHIKPPRPKIAAPDPILAIVRELHEQNVRLKWRTIRRQMNGNPGVPTWRKEGDQFEPGEFA
jgi:hypothetical protein